jgi:hypothetical protein
MISRRTLPKCARGVSGTASATAGAAPWGASGAPPICPGARPSHARLCVVRARHLPAASPPLSFERGSSPLTQRELQAAVDLLLAMGRALPLQIVSLDVVGLLTCHQPFLDAMRSDPPARGALLRGALELLRALAVRAGPGSGVVATLAGRLMGMVGQLVAEYEEVMRLRGSPQDFCQVGALGGRRGSTSSPGTLRRRARVAADCWERRGGRC